MIKVIDNYYIGADERNFIVYRQGEGKSRTTDEKYDKVKAIGFYGSLQNALRGVYKEVQLEAIQTPTLELEEALKKLEEIEKWFEVVITDVTPQLNSLNNIKRSYIKEND